MSDPDDDFAALFEASLKSKRHEKGQTIEGLAHVSTFVSTGQSGGWRRLAAVGMTAAEDVREYTEREEAAPAEAFGSLADKLRGVLKTREK